MPKDFSAIWVNQDIEKHHRRIRSKRNIQKSTLIGRLYLSPVGEDEHDPRVELRQRLGNEVLAGLGEDGADEPQVEGVGGQTAV